MVYHVYYVHSCVCFLITTFDQLIGFMKLEMNIMPLEATHPSYGIVTFVSLVISVWKLFVPVMCGVSLAPFNLMS
jgi:hypothetical protein